MPPLTAPEWAALISAVGVAGAALIKALAESAKTRAEVAGLRADLARDRKAAEASARMIAETHHQVTPNNGGSLMDSSTRSEAALGALSASVETLDENLRNTAADVRGLRRDVGRLADADQALAASDERDRAAANAAHTLIFQRLDHIERNNHV